MIMSDINHFFSLENLNKSYDRVRSKSGKNNLPINGATIDDYLLEIVSELKSGKYVPDPVRQYIRIRNDTGKEQKISILTVRDKIVQQALVNILTPLFEPEFLDCSYAYRQGRSAILAADKVQEYISQGNPWVLETDIATFFESLDHNILIERIKKKIPDHRIIDLIAAYLKAPQFHEMSFYSVEEGINIGGIISPILSNIYLQPLDQDLISGGYNYLRYSDDLVVLGNNKEEMRRALFLVKSSLKKLRLNINQSKTAIRHASEGFVFLGFRFDEKGRGPAVKAIEALQQNISLVVNKSSEVETRLQELVVLLQGWSNYYGSLTWLVPPDYSTLVALVRQAVVEGNVKWAEKLFEHKTEVQGANAELCCFLAREWLKLGWMDEALAELGLALTYDKENETARSEIASILSLSGKSVEQIVDQLMFLAVEPQCSSGYHALSEMYLEAGLYMQAQSAYTQAAVLDNKTEQIPVKDQNTVNSAVAVEHVELKPAEIELFLDLFAGRDDIYAFEVPGKDNDRIFTNKKGSINGDELNRHLSGEITLDIYLIRENHTVRLMVIDIDVSKKIMLEKADRPDELAEMIKLTQTDANRIKSASGALGISTYLEDSGYRGRHCWFFFEDPVKAKDARTIAGAIMRRAGAPSGGVTWELFPGTDRLKNTQLSHCIKLPFGRHPKSGRLGLFVDEIGCHILKQDECLKNISRISSALVEKIVATEERRQENLILDQNKVSAVTQKQSPLVNEAGSALLKPVVTGCSLVKYLILKAEDTKYLPHQDRLSLLHVLAHLGDEGKEYLHKVMACCLNYDSAITQKHITRLPEKPISCNRLREKYQSLSAALKCNCRFKLQSNNYPSPILHAIIKGREQQIKRPVVRDSFATDNGDDVSRAGELIKKMQNLRKQQQGIDNSIKKCEQQLSDLFDRLETDELAIGSGTLIRKRLKNQIKWMIEI